MSLVLASGAQLVLSSLPSPSAFSVSCWFRFDTLALSFQNVITFSNNGAEYVGMYFETPNKLQLLALPAGTLSTIGTVTTGVWYWAGCSFPATTTAGGLVYYFSTGLGAIASGSQNYTAPNATRLVLGDEDSPTDGQPLNGELMVKIFDRILSADELKNERGTLRPRAGGAYSFPMMLNAGSACGVDWSGKGHSATVAGTPTSSRLMPSVPWTGA